MFRFSATLYDQIIVRSTPARFIREGSGKLRSPSSAHQTGSFEVQKSVLLKALQQEIRRHSFDTFVYKPPSLAKEGRGVVVPGCPACKKRLETTSQFLNHLTEDVLPALIDRLSTENKKAVVD